MIYVVVKGGEKDQDLKVERQTDGSYNVTDIATNKTVKMNPSNFDFEHGALLRFDVDGQRKLIQYVDN